MKKLKKYLYPVFFSLSFWLWELLLALTILFISSNNSYAGLGVVFLFIAVWAWFVIPVYCVRYTKAIINSRFKFLFAAYNVLAILLSHLLPLNALGLFSFYGLIVLLWIATWNFVPLLLRLLSLKYQTKQPEDSYTNINLLFSNNLKYGLALGFTALYLIMLLTFSKTWQALFLYNIQNLLPVIEAGLFLAFLCYKNKNLPMKKWLLPVLFIVTFIDYGFSFISSVLYIPHSQYLVNHTLFIIGMVVNFLACAAVSLIFVGTLFNYRYISFIKYGAIALCAISTYSFLASVLTYSYFPWHLIEMPLRFLFFGGMFLLTTNKKIKLPNNV